MLNSDEFLFVRGGGLYVETGRDDRLQERHHSAKAGAELFDWMLLLSLALGEEVRATLIIFLDPFLGEAAVFDFGEKLLHGLAGFLGDDSWASSVIPAFGG